MSIQQLSPMNRVAAGIFGGIVLAASAWSVHAADTKSIDAQYKQDVANCNAGRTNQTKQVCLQEAGAARVEARRNNLVTNGGAYDANAMQRCQRLPASDRAACEAQMAGQGTTYGSVQGGGVLREMTIQVPAGTPGSAPAPGYAPPPRPAPGAGYAPRSAPAPGRMAPAPMAPAQGNMAPAQGNMAPPPMAPAPGSMAPAPAPMPGTMAPAPMAPQPMRY